MSDVIAMLTDFAKTLDPTPAEIERIREQITSQISGPSKDRILERYRQDYAEMAAIKDNASEAFFYAEAGRNHSRAAALSAGATWDEIKAIERDVQS